MSEKEVMFVFVQSWKDYRLAWDAGKYGGLNTIYVQMDLLWTPDIILHNK